MLRLSLAELAATLRSPARAEALSPFGVSPPGGAVCVLVDVDAAALRRSPAARSAGGMAGTRPSPANCVVIGIDTGMRARNAAAAAGNTAMASARVAAGERDAGQPAVAGRSSPRQRASAEARRVAVDAVRDRFVPEGQAGDARGGGDVDPVAADLVDTDLVDVVVDSEAEAERLADVVARQPLAAVLLVQLLRHNARATVADGLLAESLAYSALQHSAGFRAWLAARRPRLPRTDDTPPVLVSREGDVLHITLNRPRQRNAWSAAMRDALCEALHLLADDASLVRAVLAGAGTGFCAGGDLDEFGAAGDAAAAHVARTTRSAGALLYQLRDRVHVHVHGACVGAGIELPAFAGHVTARADAFFQLPEVAMGLLPGAGGTVSILGRIGRQRTAWLALGGHRIDAATALAWGLVDRIAD
jgi:enoyl-CoA hydratase/carnithine racemase